MVINFIFKAVTGVLQTSCAHPFKVDQHSSSFVTVTPFKDEWSCSLSRMESSSVSVGQSKGAYQPRRVIIC